MQERIIQFLKQTDGYVSGEEMSETLKVSRAAVWKCIDQLRSDGYEISAVPHLGYKFQSSPDKLIDHEIRQGLSTKSFGQNIISLDSTGSTMDEAFKLGMDGAPEGTLVCAESQTKGRGRLGRGWVSPKGKGIYCSLILRPKLTPAQMPQLTLMSAVAIAQAIETFTKIQPSIKWPNDLFIDNKKLAGILTELRAEADRVDFVVVGIGLNVNSTGSQLLDTATSLKIELEKNVNRIELLQQMLRSLESWYHKILKGHFDDVLSYCKEHSATLKKRVRIQEGTKQVEGVAVDIDKDGGILIRIDNGTIIKKMAGDITQLR